MLVITNKAIILSRAILNNWVHFFVNGLKTKTNSGSTLFGSFCDTAFNLHGEGVRRGGGLGVCVCAGGRAE